MTKMLTYGAGSLAIAWVSVLAFAQAADRLEPRKAKSSDSRKREPIVVENCQIKLIDSVVLSSQRPGVIAFVEPREGDEVEADAHVAGLMDEVPQASYEAAKALAENDVQVRYAEAAADLAKVEHEKALQANLINRTSKAKVDIYPEIEVLRLKLAATKATLEIEQAEWQKEIDRRKRDEAFEMLRTYQLKAPFDGIVTKVYKSKGAGVREGEAVLEIVSTKRVRVEGLVHIRDVSQIQEGDAIEMKINVDDADLEIEDQVFEGKIKFIDPRVSSISGEVQIMADVINKGDLLREGYDATMTVFPSKASPVTAGPSKHAPQAVSSKAPKSP